MQCVAELFSRLHSHAGAPGKLCRPACQVPLRNAQQQRCQLNSCRGGNLSTLCTHLVLDGPYSSRAGKWLPSMEGTAYLINP